VFLPFCCRAAGGGRRADTEGSASTHAHQGPIRAVRRPHHRRRFDIPPRGVYDRAAGKRPEVEQEEQTAMLTGVFTPMVTAFGADGRLDFDGNERIINHLIDSGVSGILFLGSIGEFFALRREEKEELIRFAVHVVDGRTAVLVGTGGTVVSEVIELTEHARRVGADAAVVISPYYFTLDEDSLYRYYAQVAAGCEMPILLYNFPDRTAVSMSPELVLRLARDFANVKGIKDTMDTISHTRAIINRVKGELPDFAVLSGYDEYLVPNLLAGGDGLIGGLSNIAPALLVGQFEAVRRGDLGAVAEIQKRVNILMGLYAVGQPFVGAIKAAVAMVVPGVCPACRRPAGELRDDQVAAARDILRRAGVLE
jgi:4-hydroxy-tetrahydrodipicolinate synthase